jgi:hypothetical protein
VKKHHFSQLGRPIRGLPILSIISRGYHPFSPGDILRAISRGGAQGWHGGVPLALWFVPDLRIHIIHGRFPGRLLVDKGI